jgi:hypothetical protein
MDVLALVISVLSLLVALVGTYLTNKRSKEALAASQRAAVDGRWSATQEAVQRLIGFDPSAEPIKDRLADLRIAMIALVDDLPEWTELDRLRRRRSCRSGCRCSSQITGARHADASTPLSGHPSR